ncbi:hypothetical protein Vafri_9469 [Volvox africanus]|uniref:Uncharacterized protein n=1 Tax=Volvox africanus TaxID=51714 RepID=A0A8J4EYW8_9CHLO|nr:hypothetical protein Vafri_9469 [Volvox africanus]
MDEASGATHPFPSMATWGRQSATSLDGGTVAAADGAGNGRGGRGGVQEVVGSHNTPWTLTPSTTQPSMAPHHAQNSFHMRIVQAPTSLPPASRGGNVSAMQL